MQKGLCMMHLVRLCLLVTRLDAAAPGGASSNRRWGVDTGAPGAPATTAPGHLGIQSGPRPRSSVKRERELGGPGRELKIKGGSRPGLGGCTDCNPGGLWSTPSIHHRFLFSLSPPPNFATAQISQFIAPSFSFSILQCVDRIGILKGYASHHYSSNLTSVNLEGVT